MPPIDFLDVQITAIDPWPELRAYTLAMLEILRIA